MGHNGNSVANEMGRTLRELIGDTMLIAELFIVATVIRYVLEKIIDSN